MDFIMNAMRRIGLLASVLIVCHCNAQVQGTTFAEATQMKKGKLVCRFSETPGYITAGDKGTAKGMLPEIMTSYAAYLKRNHNIDVSFVYEPFKKDTPITEIFENVNNSGDGVFGLVFVFITEERKKTLNFSSTIFESPSFLLTSSSAPELTSTKDVKEKLQGYTAYANQGNYFEDRFKELKVKNLPDLKIEYFKTYGVSNIGETIAKDKAMLYVDISGLLYAMDKKLPFKSHKVLQLSTPMGITLSKQNSWKDSFNKFLQSGFLKGNEFKKIVVDNLGHPTLNLLKIQN
jgi:ABC-type amino acid transport substrate-binding protein